MLDYASFLQKKSVTVPECGFESHEVNPKLFHWQTDIVHWALRKGKAAVFADCGLGKSCVQLQWAKEVSEHEGKPVLVLAPLAVAQQTKREGIKFGIPVTVCRTQEDVQPGINVTNYEMIDHFDVNRFCGVVLDESSCIKHKDSKTRNKLQEMFRDTPYKLCCTATPAPNDYVELGTHSEFLGVMKQTEMLATYFVHDGGETQKWRLKGHAKEHFFAWVASWACCLNSPKDIGASGEGFDLPPLRMHEIRVEADNMEKDGQMMFVSPTCQTLNERRDARRKSLFQRVEAAAKIANGTDEQVLVWCDLNVESEELTKAIHGAVEVKGSMSLEEKEAGMLAFTEGTARCLVSKASIAGFGCNWQHCHKEIFVGLSDSFESFYQAVRRCWRFGQTKPVDVYIIISDGEGTVRENIERKQRDAEAMMKSLVQYTKETLKADMGKTKRMVDEYKADKDMEIPVWLTGKGA